MSGFLRGFVVLAAGNIVGKVLALAREVVFAAAFGTGSVASGFRVAQTSSIVPANLLAGDTLTAGFAPAYSRALRERPDDARVLMWGWAFWVTSALLGLAVVVFAARDWIVLLLVPGTDDAVRLQASDFLLYLSWCLPLYGLSAVCAYGLGVHGRYALTSVRPVIQSAGLISGTVLALTTGWVAWLAAGYLAAWLVYTVLCLRLVLRSGLLAVVPSRAGIEAGWGFVRVGLIAVAPLIPLPIAVQLSIVLERVVSSLGPDGLIASVDYARTLSDTVLSLMAVPLGILGLTKLATLTDTQLEGAIARLVDAVLAVVLPLSAVLVVAAGWIVEIVFARGSFDAQAVHTTSAVLVGISVGLAFQSLGYVLARGASARGRNRSVMVWNTAGLTLQVALQFALTPVLGPLAIGLGASVSGLVLTVGMASALGCGGLVARRLAQLAPAIAVTVLVFLYFDGPLGASIVLVAWLANLLAITEMRLLALAVIARVRPALSRGGTR